MVYITQTRFVVGDRYCIYANHKDGRSFRLVDMTMAEATLKGARLAELGWHASVRKEIAR